MVESREGDASRRAALKVAGIFLVASSAWIIGSDAVVARLVPTQEMQAAFQTYKGLVYTAVMGLLIYVAVKHSFGREQRVGAALAESEVKLRAIFDHRYQLTGLLDPEGRLLAVNRTALEFVGIDQTEAIGHFFWEGPWWDRSQEPEVRSAVARASRGEYVRFETTHLDGHGKVRYFDFSLTPVKDDDGDVIYLVPEGHDVTESKQAREDLNELNTELEQRVRDRTLELERANGSLEQKHDEQKETEVELKRYSARLKQSNVDLQQFAYVASHDLQEPLRAVGGFSELLSRRYTGQLDEQADSWIEFIVQGSQRMHKLVEDLLDYSRVDSHATPFVATCCDDVLDEVTQNLHSLIEESTAQVTCGELPTIMADGSQLARLLQNLVSNAIKFRGEEPSLVDITAERDDHSWLFRVRDNGIGIATENQERVFEIFRRLHSLDEYTGTGIGLAVCRKVVLRHGGRIWIESEGVGQGSCVCFTIPAGDN